MDNLIEAGQIVNTHGLRGEVKVNPWTDFPEVFEGFKTVTLQGGAEHSVQSVRYQKNCVLLKLSGIDTIDEAQKLRNKIILVSRSLFDNLPQNTYLVADIIGLEVRDGSTVYGKVTDVINTGSNDVYTVESDSGAQILIPAIKDVITEINIKDGYMLIKPPKGLLDGVTP